MSENIYLLSRENRFIIEKASEALGMTVTELMNLMLKREIESAGIYHELSEEIKSLIE